MKLFKQLAIACIVLVSTTAIFISIFMRNETRVPDENSPSLSIDEQRALAVIYWVREVVSLNRRHNCTIESSISFCGSSFVKTSRNETIQLDWKMDNRDMQLVVDSLDGIEINVIKFKPSRYHSFENMIVNLDYQSVIYEDTRYSIHKSNQLTWVETATEQLIFDQAYSIEHNALNMGLTSDN